MPVNTREFDWNKSNLHTIQIEQGKYLHRVYRNSWPTVLYYAVRSGNTVHSHKFRFYFILDFEAVSSKPISTKSYTSFV